MGEESVQPPDQPARKSNAGRKALELDVAAMMRMRSAGKSDAEIGRKFDCSSHTVASRLRDYKPPVAPSAPVQVQRAPVRAYKAPVLPARPTPAPAPVPVKLVVAVPPHAPYGSVPEGTNTFFLVHGKLNQELAANCAQAALGIELWHHDYLSLPAFRDAEKIWVVLTPGEDNGAFILSIAGDIWIRERCLISTGGVQSVCKRRLVMERARKYEYDVFDTQQFEAIHKFQAIPLASHSDKLAELAAPATRADGSGNWDDDWRRRNGTGAR